MKTKQRGFFEITAGQWYTFLAIVGLLGYAILRGVEWLVHHIHVNWGVS